MLGDAIKVLFFPSAVRFYHLNVFSAVFGQFVFCFKTFLMVFGVIQFFVSLWLEPQVKDFLLAGLYFVTPAAQAYQMPRGQPCAKTSDLCISAYDEL